MVVQVEAVRVQKELAVWVSLHVFNLFITLKCLNINHIILNIFGVSLQSRVWWILWRWTCQGMLLKNGVSTWCCMLKWIKEPNLVVVNIVFIIKGEKVMKQHSFLVIKTIKRKTTKINDYKSWKLEVMRERWVHEFNGDFVIRELLLSLFYVCCLL